MTNERTELEQIITEQNLKPIVDFDAMAIEGVEPVSAEEFEKFINDVRDTR